MDPLQYLFGLEQFGIKFGLDNISRLVDRLGHPERSFRSVHIAGTNGKGSVTAMVDAALRAAGHGSARYTSPHLVDLSERFVIDGRPVSNDALVAAVSHVRDAVDSLRADGGLDVQPTFFEVTTAVAFELFRRAGIDVAVLEVGLGGRLDATNVVAPPHLAATAITSIALEHQKYLGTTLAEIAFEKAGIIKHGVPLVTGPLGREASAVIERIADERGAQLIRTSPADSSRFEVRLQGRISERTPRSRSGCSASSIRTASASRPMPSPPGSPIPGGPGGSKHGGSRTAANCCSMPLTTRPAPRRSRPI